MKTYWGVEYSSTHS